MSTCELPPCPPCPPPTPPPCPQICKPQAPSIPICHAKPIMRGLHWAQTKSRLAQAILLSCTGGTLVYVFIGRARKHAYADFYSHYSGEFEDWADDMARKGLFQSVPPESLKDF